MLEDGAGADASGAVDISIALVEGLGLPLGEETRLAFGGWFSLF